MEYKKNSLLIGRFPLKYAVTSGISALCTVVFLAIPFFVEAASLNLITNPSFVATTTQGAGIIPLGWNNSSWGSASGAVFTYPMPGEDDNSAANVSISSYSGVGEGNGAAEWYFNNVSVTPGGLYSFSDWYQSTAASYLIVQWTLNDGTVAYDSLAALPSTNSLWVNTPQEIFNAPLNAVSATILHLIQSTGSLTVDNYSLSLYSPVGTNALSKPMVSLTFDDGYSSQYSNALPVLRAANVAGTFYIITDDIASVPNDIFYDSQVSTSTVSTTSTVVWNNLYTDPTDQDYVFADSYTATATSTVSVNYILNGNTTSMVLGSLPRASNGAVNFSFTLPTDASGNTVSPISISQALITSGTLTVSNPSLTEPQIYMDKTKLATLQSYGNEIDSHTETHSDLTALSASSDAVEIGGSRTALKNIGISPVDTLAYPFGNYNTDIENAVSNAGYVAARTVDVGYNGTNANPLLLKTYSVVSSTTLPMVESWINTAIANKWWLILTFHEIDQAGTLAKNSEIYGATPQMLQQIISYLQSQKVQIETTDQGLAVLNNIPSQSVVTTSTLNVVVVNNNTNGGTAQSSAFTVTITGTNGVLTSFNGNSSGTAVTVLGNMAYTATESSLANYTTTFSSGCSVVLTPGTIGNCTITNTYVPAPISIKITPSILPVGKIGTAYSATLIASSSATGSFSWSISGALPSGLTIDTSSNVNMVKIIGTPTAGGIYPFTVTVQNGSVIAKQSYVISIALRLKDILTKLFQFIN